ncbi:DUF4013 domain-containing protein [Methanosphaera sp. ISO3-F5]|uniref:DUF4013 domain-containing protein n=1 Tax=Methanosphaera sp. ISO3-F5 TaxID=1452353 RepID=UPI002B262BC3|nr:DUF4013 domain-containing protein [Methanosphaera sp. ISO3-F5]WQH63596.1 DUF4013 domain-containing protein [Methanosphaera sp. ISO3-F5]
MEISEIINDALRFPFNNIMSLVLYFALSFIAALIAIFTGVSAVLTTRTNSGAGIIVTLIGIALCLVISFIIDGYALDIVKSGINRNNYGPSIDLTRQLFNGIKLFIVQIVYLIIPIIVAVILSLFLQRWIVAIISFILIILFGFVLSMAVCRLAKTEELNYALNISEAIGDLQTIGITKVLITVFAVVVITFIVVAILQLIFGAISKDIASIVTGLASIYFLFFSNRVNGLLYSEI